MKREDYLSDHDVSAFLEWAAPFVTSERSLDHSWTSPRWGTKRFRTLFDAYENYEWRFRVLERRRGVFEREGKNYAETVAFLDELRERLQANADAGDGVAFCDTADLAFQWGDSGMDVRLSANPEMWCGTPFVMMEENEREEFFSRRDNQIMLRLTATARLLDPATADLDSLADVDLMTSGFSTVYSLLIEGFPIYNSRVACALASLVRLFCHERDRDAVPETLQVAIPPYQAGQAGARRDPSCAHIRFPQVQFPDDTTGPIQMAVMARQIRETAEYARVNVMAAWLLGEMAKQAPFSEERDPLHALHSAMFMVGYAPLARPCESAR